MVWKQFKSNFERISCLYIEFVEFYLIQILKNGPYKPIVTSTTASFGTPRIPNKSIGQLCDEYKRFVGLDTKLKPVIIAVAQKNLIPFITKFKNDKSMWESLCKRFKGTKDVTEIERSFWREISVILVYWVIR